jgi:hypothetical protein
MDRLITRNLSERFTASEALQFFENMYLSVTDEQLAAEAPPQLNIDWRSGVYDRWADLPVDFVNKWSSYRAPLPSLGARLTRKIFLFYWPWGCRFLRTVRRMARFFSSIPHFRLGWSQCKHPWHNNDQCRSRHGEHVICWSPVSVNEFGKQGHRHELRLGLCQLSQLMDHVSGVRNPSVIVFLISTLFFRPAVINPITYELHWSHKDSQATPCTALSIGFLWYP